MIKKSKNTKKPTYKCWDTGLDHIDKCPEIADREVVLTIEARDKIQAMMGAMGRIEWLGFLLGRENEDGWEVSDIFIPKQEVTSATAKPTGANQEPEGTIGIIHSHHTMGTTFSGTDETHANGNFDVSLVVSSDMKFGATARIETSCGRLANVSLKVLVYTKDNEFGDWAEKMKAEKIEEKTYVYKSYSGYNDYDGYSWDNWGRKWPNNKDYKKNKDDDKKLDSWLENGEYMSICPPLRNKDGIWIREYIAGKYDHMWYNMDGAERVMALTDFIYDNVEMNDIPEMSLTGRTFEEHLSLHLPSSKDMWSVLTSMEREECILHFLSDGEHGYTLDKYMIDFDPEVWMLWTDMSQTERTSFVFEYGEMLREVRARM